MYATESEEPALAGLMPWAWPYNIELASMAPMNAASYFENHPGSRKNLLKFAMEYGVLQAADFLFKGWIPLKSNGLPRFTSIPLLWLPGSQSMILLTGSYTGDKQAASVSASLPLFPGLGVFYQWHHHEVVGIMMLVLTPAHQMVKHIGGRLFWSISTGWEYKP